MPQVLFIGFVILLVESSVVCSSASLISSFASLTTDE